MTAGPLAALAAQCGGPSARMMLGGAALQIGDGHMPSWPQPTWRASRPESSKEMCRCGWTCVWVRVYALGKVVRGTKVKRFGYHLGCSVRTRQLPRRPGGPAECSRERRCRRRHCRRAAGPAASPTRALIRCMRSLWPTAYCAMARRQRETCACSGSTAALKIFAPRISLNSRRTVATAPRRSRASSASLFMPPRKARKTALPGGVRPRNLRWTKVQASIARPSTGRNQKPESLRQRADLRLVVNQVHRDRRGIGNAAELVAKRGVDRREQIRPQPRPARP